MSAKMKKSLIILLVVLVVLIAAAAAMLILPKISSGKNSETASAVITVENPVKVAFGPNGNVSEYVLEGETWHYAENPEWPIVQTGVNRILNLLPKVTASRTIDATDDLSCYGLDPAAYTLTLTAADGSTQSLFIGDAAGELGNYARTSDSDKILILSTETNIASFMASTLLDMIDADPPASMGETAISEMTVSYMGKSASFKHKDEGWEFLGEDGNFIAEEDYSAVGSDGESHTVRKYLNDVGDAVPSFKSRGLQGYECTDAQLSEMGFDEPLTVYVLKTDGTEVTYFVGGSFTHKDGAEYYYFAVDGNPAVFRMPVSAAAPFIELVTVLGR